VNAAEVTITDAAAATGKARSTIVRALDAGRFPNAYRVGGGETAPWRIPLADLEAAGYQLLASEEVAVASPAGGGTLGGQLAVAVRALELAGQRDAEIAGWRDRLLEVERVADAATHDLARAELALEKLRGETALEKARHDRELADAIRVGPGGRGPGVATTAGLAAIAWAAVLAFEVLPAEVLAIAAAVAGAMAILLGALDRRQR